MCVALVVLIQYPESWFWVCLLLVWVGCCLAGVVCLVVVCVACFDFSVFGAVA